MAWPCPCRLYATGSSVPTIPKSDTSGLPAEAKLTSPSCMVQVVHRISKCRYTQHACKNPVVISISEHVGAFQLMDRTLVDILVVLAVVKIRIDVPPSHHLSALYIDTYAFSLRGRKKKKMDVHGKIPKIMCQNKGDFPKDKFIWPTLFSANSHSPSSTKPF